LAWDGSATILSRALQLVDRGYLDEHTVAELAGELTVGARQLNRIFARHLGASPLRVAHTHRVQTAKRLLTETGLPITQTAFASGFSSVRRFNAAFLATYGRPPLQMRRTGTDSACEPTGIVLRLAYRPPMNWPLLTRFLGAEATRGVEDVSATRYRRTIEVAGGGGWLEAQPVPGQDVMRLLVVLPEYPNLRAVTQRARQLFDLDADPSRIGGQLGRDPRLKTFVESTLGIRLPGTWDGFELAVRAVLSEIDAEDADDTLAALVAAYGQRLAGPPPGGPERLFPSPSVLRDLDAASSLREVSPDAAERIRHLSEAVLTGAIRFDPTSTFAQLVENLVTFTKLSESRAAWVAMRTLGEPDAPLLNGNACPSRDTTGSDRTSLWWRPWRSYAAIIQHTVIDMRISAKSDVCVAEASGQRRCSVEWSPHLGQE
jgi:AraC family transcriptional regulator of adaptative response / DNA-3-methyladenine glycosylase II